MFGECLRALWRRDEAVGDRQLEAAVAKADWYDPEIHPKLQSFAAHYGTVFMPTKPYTPQHKGKVRAPTAGWSRREVCQAERVEGTYVQKSRRAE